MTFCMEHEIDIMQMIKYLEVTAQHFLPKDRAEEGNALAKELSGLQRKRGSGVVSLSKVLPAVLAKYGVQLVTSIESGEVEFT